MDNRSPRGKGDERRTSAKRRRTRAAKMAYARAAVVAIVAVTAIGGSIYGIVTAARPSEAASPRGAAPQNESLPVLAVNAGAGSSSEAAAGSDAVDAVTSSTVQVLSGKELESILTKRIDTLVAATAPKQETPAQTSNTATGGTPATTTPVQTSSWGSFDPSTVGATGQGNIASWKARNSDVVGWIKVPNTNINYPVVVGPDNIYYSEKGYDKNYSYNGVIWADSETKFGGRSQISQNNVLYGHNWTNYSANPAITRASDVMFGQLTSFHHLNFAKSTPYIHYSTESEAMTWKVFAVFYTEDTFNYIASDPGASGLQYIIDEAKKRSRHKYDVDVSSSDKILTLSTCTRAYGPTSRQRFVVMARLMRPGESITEVGITNNPNHKTPQL